MKINNYFMAIITAAYSYLFYEQNAGINFLIFNLLFLAITLYRDPLLLKDKKWLWGAAMCLMSSIGILLHSSLLALFSNCLSLLLISAFSFRKQNSAALSFLFSCYSILISPVVIIVKLMRSVATNKNKYSGTLYKIAGILVVFALAALFFGLYRLSNPLFTVNTEFVNLKFINISWVIFTLAGFLIVYGLYYHCTVSFIETWENNLPLINLPGESQTSIKLETERIGGLVLFGLLNIMLLILNFGDISTLWLGSKLPEGITHSDFVHDGVQMIVFSILIAAGLIMFLFRRDFSSHKNSKLLKIFVCLWIIQTFVMLVSTAARNQIYIQEFSLTYKRIGVYVWLVLAVIGLALTTAKILYERSNWFLIRTNISVWFSILAISSLMNWDLLITKYNIKHQPITSIDFRYLFSLPDSNIPELIAITRLREFPEINKGLTGSYSNDDYTVLLKHKIEHYQKKYKSDWQSWNLNDKKITASLY